MKRLFALIAALAVMAGIGLAGSPASASVPEWDSLGVHSAAEWNAIKTAPDAQDLAFAHSLPASMGTLAKRSADECPPPPPPSNRTEYLCLWNGYGYTGTVWKIPVTWLQDSNGVNAVNGLSFTGSGINDASKGWVNNTYNTVRLYDNSSCQNSGWYRDMGAGTWALQYSAGDADWENRISSASVVGNGGGAPAGNYCFNTPGQ